MGMIIFIIASGLTLVFGLMDVLNFGHGVFIALGAFVATSVLGAMGDWTGSAELWRNMVAVLPAMLVAMAVAGALGLAFERFIVRPVYGQHLKQILITMGGMIIWRGTHQSHLGPAANPAAAARRHARLAAAGRCRHREVPLVAVAVGLVVFGVLAWTLSRTKVGLLIRAGCKTARWSKAWATASAACLWRCLWWARPWRGLGGGDVGPVPAKRGAADGRAGQRADLHRHHHRRPGQARAGR